MDWTEQLPLQLSWHWENHVRPGLDGLTDEEYFWEPVDGCWSVRPRAEARTEVVGGAGDLVAEFAYPEPVPAPVTTIAWRLAHLRVGVFGQRNTSHFGRDPIDYATAVYAGDAATALAELDEEYARWIKGVGELGLEGLARPVGPAEGPWAEHPYAELILHINREAIHHGAEILLLRDLYRHR
ncbi:MAG: DinB family protein [Acidimicrobiia bacterium]|nr:DinB family protein [Acidimicrobiia bacterium]